MSGDIVAVIPTFRPDGAALDALVAALRSAGAHVVVSDDASPCTADQVLRALAADGITVVRHRRNAGIARGLNDGFAAALHRDARWLLTVDQDTVLPDGYLAAITEAAERTQGHLGGTRLGVIAAGAIDDASGEVGYPVQMRDGIATTEEVFQTGALWSVAMLQAIGGFDTSLGIDGVDAAACLRIRQLGGVVALATDLRLQHRYGEGHQVRILGRQVVSTGHSPARRESMVRNRLRLFPAEFAQSPVHALRTVRRIAVNTALGVTIEQNRWANAKGSARGLLPRR